MRSFSIIFIILLLLSLILTFVYLGKGGFFFALLGRTRQRHFITRIICAALGLALMGLLAAAHGWTIHRSYEGPDIDPGETVEVAAMPPPAMSPKTTDGDQAQADRCGVLVNLVVVQDDIGVPRPLHAESFVIAWPQETNKSIDRQFKVGDLDFKVKLRVLDVREVVSAEKRMTAIDFDCDASARYGVIGNMTSVRGNKTVKSGRRVLVKKLLSTWSPLCWWDQLLLSRTPLTEVSVLAFLSRVREDDPLKDISLAQFAQVHSGQLGYGSEWKPKPAKFDRANFVGLLESLRLSSLVLLAAAAVLAQLFRLRSLALAGMIAVMILYAVAMDYAITRSSLATMRDNAASAEVQRTAASIAQSSFFYAKTAETGVREWHDSQSGINARGEKETSSQPDR